MDELDLPYLLEVYSNISTVIAALRSEDSKGHKKTSQPTVEDLREDIRSLKIRCREMAETIDSRNSMIYDITSRNNELLKTINEYRKTSSLKINSTELLGKRQVNCNKAVQSKADISNKCVQVYRHTKGMSEEIAKRKRLMLEDNKKLDEIIKCMTVDDK